MGNADCKHTWVLFGPHMGTLRGKTHGPHVEIVAYSSVPHKWQPTCGPWEAHTWVIHGAHGILLSGTSILWLTLSSYMTHFCKLFIAYRFYAHEEHNFIYSFDEWWKTIISYSHVLWYIYTWGIKTQSLKDWYEDAREIRCIIYQSLDSNVMSEVSHHKRFSTGNK